MSEREYLPYHDAIYRFRAQELSPRQWLKDFQHHFEPVIARAEERFANPEARRRNPEDYSLYDWHTRCFAWLADTDKYRRERPVFARIDRVTFFVLPRQVLERNETDRLTKYLKHLASVWEHWGRKMEEDCQLLEQDALGQQLKKTNPEDMRDLLQAAHDLKAFASNHNWMAQAVSEYYNELAPPLRAASAQEARVTP